MEAQAPLEVWDLSSVYKSGNVADIFSYTSIVILCNSSEVFENYFQSLFVEIAV